MSMASRPRRRLASVKRAAGRIVVTVTAIVLSALLFLEHIPSLKKRFGSGYLISSPAVSESKLRVEKEVTLEARSKDGCDEECMSCPREDSPGRGGITANGDMCTEFCADGRCWSAKHEYGKDCRDCRQRVFSSPSKNVLREECILVGGLGDSGTRAVRSMLMLLGVEMLPDKWVKTTSKDSILFINSDGDKDSWKMREGVAGRKDKAAIWKTNEEGLKPIEPDEAVRHAQGEEADGSVGPGYFYMSAIQNAKSLVYAKGALGELWNSAVQFTHDLVENHRFASMYHALEMADSKTPMPWGFKHPRNALLLPLLQDAMGQRWKFVHVIRDGRDISAGDNTKMHDQLCCIFYGAKVKGAKTKSEKKDWSCDDPRCKSSGKDARSRFASQFKFWQDTNGELVKWAAKNLGVEDRYFPVRIEDFVLKKDNACLERLSRFLGITADDSTFKTKADAVWKSYDGHEGSYGGAKYPAAKRSQYEYYLAQSTSLSRDMVANMGYDPIKFGTALSCTEWLDSLKDQGTAIPLEGLRSVLNKFGDNAPVIVGGIGDSGTRGALDLLSRLGVDMGGKADVQQRSKDSKLWTHARSKDGKGVAHLYNHGMAQGTLGYDTKLLPRSDKAVGVELLTLLLDDMWRSHVSRSDNQGSGMWGWKHPRTALVLPWFKAYLGDQFKFVHVLRNPKDIVNGDNKRLIQSGAQCAIYYNATCGRSQNTSLNLWLDMNSDVSKWASTHLLPGQYLAVHIEDIVYGSACAYNKVASFLGLKTPLRRDVLDELEKAFEPFQTSYKGKKYDPGKKAAISARFKKLARSSEVAAFGYSADDFSMDACETWDARE